MARWLAMAIVRPLALEAFEAPLWQHTTTDCLVQAEEAERRGPLQLLDSMDERFCPGSHSSKGVVALPTGFLEDLAAKHAADNNEEGLRDLMVPIGGSPHTVFYYHRNPLILQYKKAWPIHNAEPGRGPPLWQLLQRFPKPRLGVRFPFNQQVGLFPTL